MKHEQSTSDSTERGKCEGIFFNAWNLHGMKPFPHSHEKGRTAFKGIYKLIESGYLIHRPITP